MDSPIYKVPPEVLQHIAVELVLDDPVGLVPDLVPFLSTCKYIRNSLAGNDFHARLFKGKFDIGAPLRRLGPRALYSQNLAHQLQVYCATLRKIKSSNIHAPDIEGTLWNAFFMMTENDGKNAVQADWAGLPDFVDRFVRTRLNEDDIDGWPTESTTNALALWILWYTTDQDKLAFESQERRKQLFDIIMPYVILTCRYSAYHAPPNHAYAPLPFYGGYTSYPPSLPTVHGPVPLYRAPILRSLPHFRIPLTLAPPLPASSARLLFIAHRQVFPPPIPSVLPLTREDVPPMHTGPTQADIHEFNAHPHARVPLRGTWDWRSSLTADQCRLEDAGVWSPHLRAESAKWDNDFMRWSCCTDPWADGRLKGATYTFGSLAGLWQGRMLVPDGNEYFRLLGTASRAAAFGRGAPELTPYPLYMRLREHHCVSPSVPVRGGGKSDGWDDGLEDGWLPKVRIEERNDALTLYDLEDGTSTTYETYIPGQPNSHNKDTCDMCAEERDPVDTIDDVDDSDKSTSEEEDQEGEDEDEDEDDDHMYNSCSGILDIIITGETDVCHGQAWNHYRFIGRVRAWDGLVSLVRLPANPLQAHFGRWVFTGYLLGGTNFTGTWRVLGGGESGVLPTYEGAFVASRRD